MNRVPHIAEPSSLLLPFLPALVPPLRSRFAVEAAPPSSHLKAGIVF